MGNRISPAQPTRPARALPSPSPTTTPHCSPPAASRPSRERHAHLHACAECRGRRPVTIRAIDDGGTANGGNDTSPLQTVQITLAAVNDAPSFTAGADQTVVEDAGPKACPVGPPHQPRPRQRVTQTVSFASRATTRALLSRRPAGHRRHGTLTFTPATGANGTAIVTSARSTTVARSTAASTRRRTDVHDHHHEPPDPVAIADSATVAENDTAGVTFNVLANDTDAEGDPLTVSSYDDSTIANGSLTDNGGGSFTYTPRPRFAGTDTFSYVASDGNGGTASASVTITVTPVQHPPVAADDAYTTAQDTPLTSCSARSPGNDGDQDGDTLTLQTTPVITPPNGMLALAADGSFTYTPNTGQRHRLLHLPHHHSVTGLYSDGMVTITISATSSSLQPLSHRTGPSSELWNISSTPTRRPTTRPRLRQRPRTRPHDQIQRRQRQGRSRQISDLALPARKPAHAQWPGHPPPLEHPARRPRRRHRLRLPLRLHRRRRHLYPDRLRRDGGQALERSRPMGTARHLGRHRQPHPPDRARAPPPPLRRPRRPVDRHDRRPPDKPRTHDPIGVVPCDCTARPQLARACELQRPGHHQLQMTVRLTDCGGFSSARE